MTKPPRKCSNILNRIFKTPINPTEEIAMFEINFPIPEIEIKMKESSENERKIETNNTEFWFIKGYETAKKGAIEPAMDLYIQGLLLNDSHAPSYHNLGCWANYLKKTSTAFKFFERANKIDPLNFNTIYAIILISLKIGNLDMAIDYINIAKDLYWKDKNLSTNIIYFEALCYKLDKNFEKANEWYRKIAQELYMKEKALVVKYTVGLLLIPTIEK